LLTIWLSREDNAISQGSDGHSEDGIPKKYQSLNGLGTGFDVIISFVFGDLKYITILFVYCRIFVRTIVINALLWGEYWESSEITKNKLHERNRIDFILSMNM